MTVIVLTAVSAGLRGHLNRWLLEISPGVFIGRIPSRVRELLWTRVRAFITNGQALMAYTSRNEQGFSFEVLNHDWQPVDFEGISLIKRKHAPNADYD